MTNGRKCSSCGNDDFDDGFVIIKCSQCGHMYEAATAQEVTIDFPFVDRSPQ